jgi:hypothetical protein
MTREQRNGESQKHRPSLGTRAPMSHRTRFRFRAVLILAVLVIVAGLVARLYVAFRGPGQ